MDQGPVRTRMTVPTTGPPIIHRPRLHALLDAAALHPVTLVTAGPGTGKTTALADWAQRRTRPTVWVTLTSSDSTPRALVSTIHRAVLSVLGRGYMLGHPSVGMDLLDEATEVLRLTAAHHCAVVLDDVDALGRGPAVEFLHDLVRRPTDGLCLILISQQGRPHLNHLDVAGDLGHLQHRDLAFTSAEASALFTASGVDLTEAALAHIMTTTEGWATGLRLAAMALTADDAPAVPTLFNGSHRLVLDYVLRELEELGAAEQNLALSSCIVTEITGGLAVILSDDPKAGTRLESLLRDGFLLSGLDAGTYRLPMLARQSLRAHLLATRPRAHAELHRRAATWFETQGLLGKATFHATNSRDWDFVGSFFLRSVVPGLHTMRWEEAAELLGHVPIWAIRGRVELELALAHQLFVRDDVGTAVTLLETACVRLDSLPPPRREVARLSAQVLRAFLAERRGDVREMVTQAALAHEVLRGLSADVAPAWSRQSHVVEFLVARAYYWSGQPDRAAQLVESGAVWSEGLQGVEAQAHLALFLVSAGQVYRGRLLAEAVLSDAMASPHHLAPARLARATAAVLQRDASRWQLADAHAPSARQPLLSAAHLLVSAAGQWSAGDLGAARRALAACGRLISGFVEASTIIDVHAALSIAVAISSGDLREATVIAAGSHGGREHTTLQTLAGAGLLLSKGLPGEAIRSLEWLREDTGIVGAAAWLWTALAADALRQDSYAITALDRTLAVAAPESLNLLFLPIGHRLHTMLRRHLEVADSHADFVRTLLQHSGSPASALAPHIPLTEREVSVLAYLPTLNSNVQIAEALGISVNTVKQHLKSIHRKLNVSTRRDALMAAKQLHLLPHLGWTPSDPQNGNNSGTTRMPTTP